MTTLSRRQRPPYRGLDMQGRYPDAAPIADTPDPDLDAARGIVLGVALALSLWLVLILAALAIWMPV